MTYKEKEEKIIKWFRDNNVFEKFMYNLRTQRPDYNPFTKEKLNGLLLAKSFSWMFTPEGVDFWKSIDKKYYEFYGNLTTNKITKMEEKSIKMEEPEGYEIDKEKSTFENIVFKKKKVKPWRKESHNIDGYYISTCSIIVPVKYAEWMPKNSNIFATEKQAKSALVMAQISQIMTNDPRFGGPITDEEWKDQTNIKYVITRHLNSISKDDYCITYAFLAFHTPKQRDLFLEENEDLVKDYLMIE